MRGKKIVALVAVAILSMGADGGCDPKGDPIATAPAPAPADPKPKKPKTQETPKDRTVILTVVWTVEPGVWAQVQYWVNAELQGTFRPADGRWVTEVHAKPGTPILLKGLMRNSGEMSCLAQVIGGEQDRDIRSGRGSVNCKVYA